MTAEVAIMNQHALVFAADSATTVTMWAKGEKQVRYFKGANKLFQLSKLHPVGLMINGSASLQDVPWELIVKEFRKTLSGNSYPKLVDYAHQFFEFTKNHSGLFPEQARNDFFYRAVMQALESQVVAIFKTASVAEASDDQREKVILNLVQEKINYYKSNSPTQPVAQPDIDAAVAAHTVEVQARIESEVRRTGGVDLKISRELAELAIRAMMFEYTTYLSNTGVVIGGYGEEEFFPSFEVFDCFGFLDRHFVAVRQDTSKAIKSDVAAAIEPFATTSMINTFRMGMGPDVFSIVRKATRNALTELAEKLRLQLAPEGTIENLQGLIDGVEASCQKEWFHTTVGEHYGPLSRVVGSLPIADMAALAKSLIELQSLKERVTDSSESVSGPIDVAAITKHDGFVWIERKHYFKPELNPRFFLRQQSLT
jgi:hypothetical protein